MKKNLDRRIRKTRLQLRTGLAKLLEEKPIREITVKELVDIVDINRSTFYLHYHDIFHMLECIESELMEEIKDVIKNHPLEIVSDVSTPDFLIQLFTVLAKNQEICHALMGPHGDIAFVDQIEKLIASNTVSHLMPKGHAKPEDFFYAYTYGLNGCVGMIRSWLSRQANESPEYMAHLMHELIINTRRIFTEKKA